MNPTRDECSDFFLDIMMRLDIEEPETAQQAWVLLGETNGLFPDAARARVTQILVPRLTPDEAARLHALMGSSPLE